MMFASPPEQTLEWSDSGVECAYRFLKRVWAFGHGSRGQEKGVRLELPQEKGVRLELRDSCNSNLTPFPSFPPATLAAGPAALRREIHLLLKQANYDLGKLQFNTVASATMKMLNAMEKAPKDDAHAPVLNEGFGILLRVLSPIAPHICHALWIELGHGADILAAAWPEPVEAALVQDEEELVLQVNGKHRGNIRVKVGADRTAIEAVALAAEAAQKFMEGKPAKKVVVVPGRLVNIVV
jgi:leucyl-tRNA synthetase